MCLYNHRTDSTSTAQPHRRQSHSHHTHTYNASGRLFFIFAVYTQRLGVKGTSIHNGCQRRRMPRVHGAAQIHRGAGLQTLLLLSMPQGDAGPKCIRLPTVQGRIRDNSRPKDKMPAQGKGWCVARASQTTPGNKTPESVATGNHNNRAVRQRSIRRRCDTPSPVRALRRDTRSKLPTAPFFVPVTSHMRKMRIHSTRHWNQHRLHCMHDARAEYGQARINQSPLTVDTASSRRVNRAYTHNW